MIWNFNKEKQQKKNLQTSNFRGIFSTPEMEMATFPLIWGFYQDFHTCQPWAGGLGLKVWRTKRLGGARDPCLDHIFWGMSGNAIKIFGQIYWGDTYNSNNLAILRGASCSCRYGVTLLYFRFWFHSPYSIFSSLVILKRLSFSWLFFC